MSADLYQQAIIEWAKRAAGDQRLEDPEVSVTVDNPLCGDRVTLELVLDDGRIAKVGQRTRGCLLCQAAAAIIAERAPGESSEELRLQRDATARLLEGGTLSPQAWPDLSIFEPATAYKSRHQCVLLPFDALEQALRKSE